MNAEIKTEEPGLSSSLLEQTSQDGSGVFTGSIFEIDRNRIGKVLHWKRHWVSQFLGVTMLAFDVCVISAIYLFMVGMWYDGPLWAASSQIVHFVLVSTSIVSVYLIGGYDYHEDKRKFRFLCEHLIVSLAVLFVAFFAVYAVAFYGKNLNTARLTVLVPLVGFPIVSILYRKFLSNAHAKLRRENAVCIIGAGLEARDIYRRVQRQGAEREVIVVSPDGSHAGKPLVPWDDDSPIVHNHEDLQLNSSVNGKFVESYILAGKCEDLSSEFMKRLAVAQFNGNSIYTYESYLTQVLRIVPPSQLTIDWAFTEGFRLNRNLTYDRMKRLMDIVAAGIGLVVASPVFLATAIAVKVTSKGPIIFKQTRVGEKEKPFTILKFRTMKVGSEKGNKYTQVGDSRITSVGNFLRKSRLDELPQLWNVLRGDLALIGPRAEWIDLVKDYQEKFPYYHFRHAVKPGVTGWAQVNYGYGADDEDTIEKLYYDLYYVRHFSLILDLSICVRTVFMMVFGHGR